MWPRVNINDIFVVTSFRRQGIGRLLLEHAKALSKTNSWDNLTAQVWHGNDASYALFRACGFAPQSEFLRFGPETQARDYPMPARAAKPSRFNKWLFNVILPISIIISISVFAESISRIWQSR